MTLEILNMIKDLCLKEPNFSACKKKDVACFDKKFASETKRLEDCKKVKLDLKTGRGAGECMAESGGKLKSELEIAVECDKN